MTRYAFKVDQNQAEVVRALLDAGATVEIIKQPLDLLVGCGTDNHRLMIMEVKNPKTGYGKRGMNAKQQEFKDRWEGYPISSVDSEESALRALKLLRSEP